MQIAIKVVVALIAVLFVVLASGVMLDPASAPDRYAVESLGLVGSSTLRGDLGGMFLGAALMLAWGLLSGRTTLFFAVAVLMGSIPFARNRFCYRRGQWPGDHAICCRAGNGRNPRIRPRASGYDQLTESAPVA